MTARVAYSCSSPLQIIIKLNIHKLWDINIAATIAWRN